jgi:tetratricopeptide (TPR) repeat protein
MRIERTNSQGLLRYFPLAGFGVALFILGIVFCGAARAKGQAPVEDGLIRTIENSLRAATEQHASPERLGVLWHALGIVYQNGFEYDKAEDAYGHAIHLLRNTALKAQYADSLHRTAEICMMESRVKEVRDNDAQALAIFEELGDTRSAASVRGTTAMGLLRGHKFQEAEAEASRALAVLETLEKPDRIDLENTYVTRARALAGEGRPQAALEDVARARAIATGNPASNKVDAIATLLVQGEVQMQAGLETEGKQSMTEALKLARSLTGLPPATSATLEASILEREVASLRKAHHIEDAKVLEGEMKQAQSAARAGCNGCTVSVMSLLPR